MGAEQSHTVGQKLIDFSQQVTEPITDDKLGKLIQDVLQTLPTKVQKDIKTLIRGRRQHRVSGSTTFAAAPIVTIPNIILSNPNIKPAEFFECQLKFTGLCNYISDIDINEESNIIRVRFALKQFYLTLSSWGHGMSKLKDQLREKGDKLPVKSTRSDWKKEGLAYQKFVDFYGHGILFVLPFSRKESRVFDFKQVQNQNTLQAAKDTALSYEETGKTFSRYLAAKQRADGLYNETIARVEGGASGQTDDQPSVDCSLVDSREVQHTTASSLPLISDQGVVPGTVNSDSQAEVATPSSQGTPSRCQDDLSAAFGLSAYNNSPNEASMHSNANAVEVASAGSPSSVCSPTITGPSTPQLQSNRSEEERSPKRQKTQHGALLRLSFPAGDETSEPHHGSRTSHHSHGHLSDHDMNLGDCAVVSAEYNFDYTQDENIPTLSLGGQNVSSVNTNTSAPSSPENDPQQNVPDPGQEPRPVVSSGSDAEVMTTEPTSQAAILESITSAQNPSHQVYMSTPSHTPAELVPNVPGTIGSREQQDLPSVRFLLDAVDARTHGDQVSNTQNNLDVQGLDFGNHFVFSFRSSEGLQGVDEVHPTIDSGSQHGQISPCHADTDVERTLESPPRLQSVERDVQNVMGPFFGSSKDTVNPTGNSAQTGQSVDSVAPEQAFQDIATDFDGSITEVDMRLPGPDGRPDLATSSLSLLSFAADIVRGSPSGASLSIFQEGSQPRPALRSDTQHCEVGDDEEGLNAMFDGVPVTEQIDIGALEGFSFSWENYLNFDA